MTDPISKPAAELTDRELDEAAETAKEIIAWGSLNQHGRLMDEIREADMLNLASQFVTLARHVQQQQDETPIDLMRRGCFKWGLCVIPDITKTRSSYRSGMTTFETYVLLCGEATTTDAITGVAKSNRRITSVAE